MKLDMCETYGFPENSCEKEQEVGSRYCMVGVVVNV